MSGKASATASLKAMSRGGARENALALSGNVVERIVLYIRTGIREQRYAPGYRLIESDLTQELGVSRGPVREALMRLSVEGSVEIIEHRGAFIRRHSLREIRELFQIRTAMECLAIELLAERMKDDKVRADFKAMTAVIWRDDMPTPVTYFHENSEFHNTIMQLSGNEQLALFYQRMQLSLLATQAESAIGAQNIEQSRIRHRRIADALLDDHPSLAVALMREHMRKSIELLEACPPSTFRKD